MGLDYSIVLLFLLAGTVMVAAPVLLLRIVRPHEPTDEKLIPYECGEDVIGDTRPQFDMRFYTVALVYLLFDVEIAFLFPWAVVYKEVGVVALLEGGIFITILLAGLAYVWANGDLDWIKSVGGQPMRYGPVGMDSHVPKPIAPTRYDPPEPGPASAEKVSVDREAAAGRGATSADDATADETTVGASDRGSAS